MIDTNDEAAMHRQHLAQEIRQTVEANDALLLGLAAEYAVNYRSRIPALEEIDLLLREEGTADVIDAVRVLDSILVDHPAYAVVRRLRQQYVDLPPDRAIAEAINAECNELRNLPLPRLRLTVEGNGLLARSDMAENVGWIVNHVTKRLRERRLAQTEALVPERVAYVWQLCQMLGIKPFDSNGQRLPV